MLRYYLDGTSNNTIVLTWYMSKTLNIGVQKKKNIVVP